MPKIWLLVVEQHILPLPTDTSPAHPVCREPQYFSDFLGKIMIFSANANTPIVVVGNLKSFQPQKPQFSLFENNTGQSDGRTVGQTDERTDGRTRPRIEMRSRI